MCGATSSCGRARGSNSPPGGPLSRPRLAEGIAVEAIKRHKLTPAPTPGHHGQAVHCAGDYGQRRGDKALATIGGRACAPERRAIAPNDNLRVRRHSRWVAVVSHERQIALDRRHQRPDAEARETRGDRVAGEVDPAARLAVPVDAVP